MKLFRFATLTLLGLSPTAQADDWRTTAPASGKMENLLKTLKITRPGRAKTADEFLEAVFPTISEATADRNWQQFVHAFITLPIPKSANSPVLALD